MASFCLSSATNSSKSVRRSSWSFAAFQIEDPAKRLSAVRKVEYE
jgi:hypothetical protein